MRTFLGVLLVAVAACGGGESEGKSGGTSEAPPEKPATGAPIAFIATDIKAGEGFDGAVKVKGYNFADKDVAQYTVLVRFKDDGGDVLRVKKGTPFEKSFGFTSLSGNKFKCAAKSWCNLTLEGLDVPAEARTADVIAARVTALKDATSFEDEPLFQLESGTLDWPASIP